MSTVQGEAFTDDVVVERLLNRRFSCRAFEEGQVGRRTIERVLTLAQRSPSWCNVQPWQVIVTEGDATERLRVAASTFARSNGLEPDVPFPESYEGVFQQRRRECGWQLYESVGIARGDRAASAAQAARNFEFFGAPHVAIVTTERVLGTYGAIDCGVYLACFLLAAESMGLSTIPQAALGGVAPAIRELFDLPAERQVLFGVAFGYGNSDDPVNAFRTSRAALEEVVTWEA